jgi:hypothetical protein
MTGPREIPPHAFVWPTIPNPAYSTPEAVLDWYQRESDKCAAEGCGLRPDAQPHWRMAGPPIVSNEPVTITPIDPPKVVRVLRLLEYTYASQERAEQDMAHWQIPANGARSIGPASSPKRTVIRSAVIPQETIFQEPELPVEQTIAPHHFLVPSVASSSMGCARSGCGKELDDPIHRTEWFENTGPEEDEPAPMTPADFPLPRPASELSDLRYAPATFSAEIMAKARRPHAYLGRSDQRCDLLGCALPRRAEVHWIAKSQSTGPTVADGTQGMRRGE